MPTVVSPRTQPCPIDLIVAEYFKGIAGQRGSTTLDLAIKSKPGQLGNEGTQFDIMYEVDDDGAMTLRLLIDAVPVWIGRLRA